MPAAQSRVTRFQLAETVGRGTIQPPNFLSMHILRKPRAYGIEMLAPWCA
jgi:hypothetical protein